MFHTIPRPAPPVHLLIQRCAYATAALTALPIPGSEVLGVMPIHVSMIVGIAHHHGHELSAESAGELVLQIGGTVGLSLVGSRLASTAAKFVLPGFGGLIAAPFLYAGTVGLGTVADAWFREGQLSDAEMRDLFRRAQREAKSAFDPDQACASDGAPEDPDADEPLGAAAVGA